MSRAQEIKKKHEIQAKFQLAMNNTSVHVLSWLKPLKTNEESVDDDPSKSDFFNLPIIGGSSGLSLTSEATSDNSDINTIGDYVKTGKSLSSLKNKKNNSHHSKVVKPSSKALQALQNKIRKTNVVKKKSTISSSLAEKPKVRRNDSDSDDEEIVQKSSKKSFSLLLDTKRKKK